MVCANCGRPTLVGCLSCTPMYKFRKISNQTYSVEKWNGNSWIFLQTIIDHFALLKDISWAFVSSWKNVEDRLTEVCLGQ